MKKISRFLIFAFIISSLVFRNILLIPGFGIGDIAIFCTIPILINKRNCKVFVCDMIAKYTLIYIVIMLLSSLVNNTISHTSFINYFRILLEGYITYIALRMCLSTESDINLFVKIFLLFVILFIFSARAIMETSFEVESYEKMDFDRTNWGFTNVLLLMFVLFVFHLKKYNKFFLLLLILLVCYNIIFSVSRFAIFVTVFLFIIFRIWRGDKIGWKEIFSYALILSSIPFLIGLMDRTLDVSIVEGSRAYLEYKMEGTKDDAFTVRVIEINYKPIMAFIGDSNPFEFLFGTGDTITHGILSQTFISTGFIGFIYFLCTHYRMIIYNLRKDKFRKLASLLMIVMFVNDFNTNCRFEVANNTVIYMLLLAFFVSYSDLRLIKINKRL